MVFAWCGGPEFIAGIVSQNELVGAALASPRLIAGEVISSAFPYREQPCQSPDRPWR